ncbi:7678_t:CDS:2 [Paraglomus brasilianum]|uniref:7678_t:CDS:1 n=1 Tax=Paraglomus brasilianum TaxID=144538 RepID=A0A9N9FEV8_9GLOM|nr:7678_t:CDS:2 [Paraglomus brasilianum]
MYKQIVIALLLFVSLFSVNAMPATNALSEQNNEKRPDSIIAQAEFRTAKAGFEATFTFVQLPSDGDNDSDDHQVFVTSLIVLSRNLRVEASIVSAQAQTGNVSLPGRNTWHLCSSGVVDAIRYLVTTSAQKLTLTPNFGSITNGNGDPITKPCSTGILAYASDTELLNSTLDSYFTQQSW